MSKAHSATESTAALFDSATEPTDHDLKLALGPCHQALADVVDWLRDVQPALISEWKYAPLSGWYRVYVLKKRRMFYLIPRWRGFRIVILLGDRALTALRHGALAGGAEALISEAKRYPEGTAFTLESRGFYPEVAIALLAAKLEA